MRIPVRFGDRAALPVAAHRVGVAGLGEARLVPGGHPGGLPVGGLVLVGRQRETGQSGGGQVAVDGLGHGDGIVDITLVVVGDHVRHRAGCFDMRQPRLPLARVPLRGEGEGWPDDLGVRGDPPDFPVGGVPHLEVLGSVDAGLPEDRQLRLVPDVVSEPQPGGLQSADGGVDEADPVRAVAIGARVDRVGGLAGVRPVQVADQHLILHVMVGRPLQAPGLRDDRGNVRLGGRTVLVAIVDPATGKPAPAAEGVDVQRLHVLVGGLSAILAYPVEEALADAGRRPVVEARFTLSDSTPDGSAPAAVAAGPSSGTVAARISPAARARRPDLDLILISCLPFWIASAHLARVPGRATTWARPQR